MVDEKSLDTKKIIMEWLNKEKAPFEIDGDSKERIANLCVEWQYEKQNRETFEKEIDKEISELAKKHLDSGI